MKYFHERLDGGGLVVGGNFWEHVQGWWGARPLPNILLVHFNHLKADLPGQMHRIANFLDIKIDEARWPQMVEHCAQAEGRVVGFEHGGDGFQGLLGQALDAVI
jgi:aryl sulfotransferase